MEKSVGRSGNTVTELASEARSQLFGQKKSNVDESKAKPGGGRSESEERLLAMRGKKPKGD